MLEPKLRRAQWSGAKATMLTPALASPSRAVLPWRRLCQTLSALVLAGLSLGAQAVDLTAFTEDWPPYNYRSDDGSIKGIATDMLRAACAEAKLSCDIQLVPWARAYATAQNTPNTLVYTTARKPSRESEFLWVGPILPRTTWIYARADAVPAINSVKDLPLFRYAVVRGEAAAQDLMDAGVPAASLVQESSNASVLRVLSKGWVDGMVDTEIGMQWSLRQFEHSGGLKVTRLIPLNDQGAYFFAVNLKTDPALVARLQRGLDALRRTGKLEAIERDYLQPNVRGTAKRD